MTSKVKIGAIVIAVFLLLGGSILLAFKLSEKGEPVPATETTATTEAPTTEQYSEPQVETAPANGGADEETSSMQETRDIPNADVESPLDYLATDGTHRNTGAVSITIPCGDEDITFSFGAKSNIDKAIVLNPQCSAVGGTRTIGYTFTGTTGSLLFDGEQDSIYNFREKGVVSNYIKDTFDKCWDATYHDDQHFGLAWCIENFDVDTGTQIDVRALDLRNYNLLAVMRITIERDQTGQFVITQIEDTSIKDEAKCAHMVEIARDYFFNLSNIVTADTVFDGQRAIVEKRTYATYYAQYLSEEKPKVRYSGLAEYPMYAVTINMNDGLFGQFTAYLIPTYDANGNETDYYMVDGFDAPCRIDHDQLAFYGIDGF